MSTAANSAPLTMLVDSSSLVYRAFFAVPDTIRAPDGTLVNGVQGFLNMLARLITTYSPHFLACCLDVDWRPQWRVDLLESYKSHRVAGPDEPGDGVDIQLDIVVEALGLMGIATAGAAGYEAEDAIGTLAARASNRVAIVSGDRDLFQLVRDPDVCVLYPVRGVSELTVVDEAEITRRYSIPGRAYGDYAILRGDPSDGLPGVRGVGDKSAAALIAQHGTLEAIVEASKAATTGALAKVAGAGDYVTRAARVVRITDEAPIGDIDITLPVAAPDPSLWEFAKRYGLRNSVDRVLAAIDGGSSASS